MKRIVERDVIGFDRYYIEQEVHVLDFDEAVEFIKNNKWEHGSDTQASIEFVGKTAFLVREIASTIVQDRTEVDLILFESAELKSWNLVGFFPKKRGASDLLVLYRDPIHRTILYSDTGSSGVKIPETVQYFKVWLPATVAFIICKRLSSGKGYSLTNLAFYPTTVNEFRKGLKARILRVFPIHNVYNGGDRVCFGNMKTHFDKKEHSLYTWGEYMATQFFKQVMNNDLNNDILFGGYSSWQQKSKNQVEAEIERKFRSSLTIEKRINGRDD